MALFLRTNLDPEGTLLRIEGGYRSANNTCFLVLHRLPPHYAKPPTFVVQLSSEVLEVRGAQTQRFYKAYARQEFTPKELNYLKDIAKGQNHAPFFNFSYPHVLKRIGKVVCRMTDAEVSALVDTRYWKLIPED